MIPEPYAIKAWPIVCQSEDEKHAMIDELQELIDKSFSNAALAFRRSSEPPLPGDTLRSRRNSQFAKPLPASPSSEV